MLQSCDKIGEAVISIDVNSDLRKVIDQKATGPNQPEQVLLDYYVSIAATHYHGGLEELTRDASQDVLYTIINKMVRLRMVTIL